MHTLQRAVFPSFSLCSQMELYFRYNEFVDLDINNRILKLAKFGVFSTDTYFNSISVGKWKRHTNVDSLQFLIKFKASFFSVSVKLNCDKSFTNSSSVLVFK